MNEYYSPSEEKFYSSNKSLSEFSKEKGGMKLFHFSKGAIYTNQILIKLGETEPPSWLEEQGLFFVKNLKSSHYSLFELPYCYDYLDKLSSILSRLGEESYLSGFEKLCIMSR